MQYRKVGKNGQELSLLGFGCMRFPRKLGAIDQQQVDKLLQYALDQGINYFDTAYIYPGSEEALGKFIAKSGKRAQMLIATKMPHYRCKSVSDMDKILAEELKRLQTGYIDYYLMHMLTDFNSWQRCVDMGVPEWIERKKEEGIIRHVGFSFHGGRDDFMRIVDAYPWEFCQIQLNYMDAGAQAGLDGLFYAAARNLPVIIMEPLRGGKLATNLPKGAKHAFEQANHERENKGFPAYSPASWALRWLYDLPEVTCVLSGMNDMAQLEENCKLAGSARPHSLTPLDDKAYDEAIAALKANEKVPCTGCGYCMPCPKGIDIPTCFRAYNTRYSEGWLSGTIAYVQTTALVKQPKNAGLCIGCGKCAKHCPQSIDIPSFMNEIRHTMEGPVYQAVNKVKGVFWKM